ncbi:hypothetical protein CP533_3856 [Ophiocordyceps camponoti-saundersi (nom. inval.)]|nr:hypothetical protein CP533_3856 [Ophiocordyceps camponoti-saundersi (nom. inval.)]
MEGNNSNPVIATAEPALPDAAAPSTATERPPTLSLDVSEPPTVRSKLRIYTILTALAATLDQTIVSTAAPSIAAHLHASSAHTWIGASSLLANAACGPVWVKGSDIWGRKPAMLCSIAVFGAASVVVASSVHMPMLIAGRALQGAAGGGLMQLVYIVVSDLFGLRSRALYLSAMGFVWLLAGTSGPVFGGALSQFASWRWCFWINVPVCVVTFVVVLFFLDLHNPRTKLSDGLMAIDWLGTLSIFAVTLLLLLGLDFGGVIYPWSSPKVVCLIVFGALMLAFFLYSEKRLAKHPLMLLSVFEHRSNNAIVIVAFTHSMASFGFEYHLPLYFQTVKQASPLQSGLLLLPMVITCAVVDILGGVFMHQTGRYRELIWAGTTCMTLGAGLCTMFGTDTTLGTIFGFQIVFGFGMSLLFQTPTMALQNSVSQADTATATATLNLMRSLATSLSTVLGGLVFQNSMTARSASLAASRLSKPQLEALSGHRAAANAHIARTIHDPVQRQAVKEAFAWSIRNMFIMYTCIAAVGVLASAWVKQRHMSKEHTETKTGLDNMTKQNVMRRS